MMSAIFYFQPSLNRLPTFMLVPDICHVSENVVKMHMRSRRDIVQLGNVSRGFGCPGCPTVDFRYFRA